MTGRAGFRPVTVTRILVPLRPERAPLASQAWVPTPGASSHPFGRLTTPHVRARVATVGTGDITASPLLAHADRNLYATKRMGRNRVVGDPPDLA